MHKLPIVPSYTFFPQNQICYEISRIPPPPPLSVVASPYSQVVSVSTQRHAPNAPLRIQINSRDTVVSKSGANLIYFFDLIIFQTERLHLEKVQIKFGAQDSFTWRSIPSGCSRWSQRSDVRSQKTSPDVTNKPFIRYTIKLSKKKRHLVIPGRQSYFHNTPLRRQGIASGRFLTSGTSGS